MTIDILAVIQLEGRQWPKPLSSVNAREGSRHVCVVSN